MNFFTRRKNNASFLRYLDFCVFVKSTDFKVYDVIIGIAMEGKLKFRLFLLNPKYCQNESWSNTSVLCDRHLTCLCFNVRLETSCRPFYDFIKMKI